MESEGGSGYWIVRTDRSKSAEYVILIRNHREVKESNFYKKSLLSQNWI